ncbi:MAG: cysteine desulfurase family protein [Paracoccaceae bacterium]
MSAHIYLDWNASAPLCTAAREAMIEAIDLIGNPSSVHGPGRAVKAAIENARAHLSDACGASGADIVFTSGATEAAALALVGRSLKCSAAEHDAVLAWADPVLNTCKNGAIAAELPGENAIQLANGETGVVQKLTAGLAVSDVTQAFGKIPMAFDWLGCDMALMSAHKLGGPRGVGALVLKQGLDVTAQLRGGGQEMGRRSGTENLIGIVGFGAAAKAAAKDLADGVWEQVATRRDQMEAAILSEVPEAIIVGKDSPRLPNTSCIMVPGWKGETQVMLMDLAGFAISAGSACSSGKVKPSRVLQAMGYCEDQSKSAIRVSIGPSTTENEIFQFADAWTQAHKRYRAKAA